MRCDCKFEILFVVFHLSPDISFLFFFLFISFSLLLHLLLFIRCDHCESKQTKKNHFLRVSKCLFRFSSSVFSSFFFLSVLLSLYSPQKFVTIPAPAPLLSIQVLLIHS